MAGMMEYLDWRGDLTFQKDPFNEVDNLLLSQIAYVKMEGLVPGFGEKPVRIGEVCDRFFSEYSEEELKKDRSFVHLAPYLMKKMSETDRFRNLKIGRFCCQTSVEKEMQFAAMEMLLDEETSYLAFRGTDDRIVGWKEDFRLSHETVKAETAAVAYVNRVAEETGRKLILGGHSKGGNLCVYAAALCKEEVQDRILSVWCNDGPGFSGDFTKSEGLKKVKNKIRRFVPESSLIGVILEPACEAVYIKSSERGVLQHDAMSWQILGNHFVTAQEQSLLGQTFEDTMRQWLNGIDPDGRKKFIEEIFGVLEAPGAETLTELQDGGIRNFYQMIKKLETLDPEIRKDLQDLSRIFTASLVEHFGKNVMLHSGHGSEGRGV